MRSLFFAYSKRTAFSDLRSLLFFCVKNAVFSRKCDPCVYDDIYDGINNDNDGNNNNDFFSFSSTSLSSSAFPARSLRFIYMRCFFVHVTGFFYYPNI